MNEQRTAPKHLPVKERLDSSLGYLKKVPIDTLKIDRSFIGGLSSDADDMLLVCSIIELARSFRLVVVAEGVETQEHLEILKKLGCLQYQGYLFSKPITAKEFEDLIKR